MLDPEVNAPEEAINRAAIVSDPWNTENSSASPPTTQEWLAVSEIHPLISAAGVPGLYQLAPGDRPSAQLSSAEVLLQDELKIPVTQNSQLRQQIGKSLSLIWWTGESSSFWQPS